MVISLRKVVLRQMPPRFKNRLDFCLNLRSKSPETTFPLDPVNSAPTLTQRTVGAAAWAAMGTWGQALLRFVVLIVLVRLLGPQEFGTMALALSFSQLALVLADLGIGQ